MKCRICGEEIEALETVHGCRDEYLSFQDSPFVNRTCDVALFRCGGCTHIQSEYRCPEEFYINYESEAGASQYSGRLVTTEHKIEKLAQYSKSRNKLVEIGSGGGSALYSAAKSFARCIGVEPAEHLSELARERGFEIINAYFDSSLKLAEKFSAFMAFQVFEHLEDVYAVLDYAYEVLEPGGVGLINVPNGQTIMQNGLYHQIVDEHVNYFSTHSLMAMARRSGFDCIEIENVSEAVELDIYLRKPLDFPGLNATRDRNRSRMAECLLGYEAVIIWGAGAKSCSYSELLPKNFLAAHLVDSDIRKTGKYTSGISAQIEMVDKSMLEQCDCVLIFASAYNREIMDELYNRYLYRGKVIYFENDAVKSATGDYLA